MQSRRLKTVLYIYTLVKQKNIARVWKEQLWWRGTGKIMGTEDLESLCGGLPPELCEQLVKEQQIIKIRLEKRKFGKEVTIIEGIDEREVNLKKLASQLKSRLATGGTAKNGRIELQGDHRASLKEILVELGFPPDSIVVIS